MSDGIEVDVPALPEAELLEELDEPPLAAAEAVLTVFVKPSNQRSIVPMTLSDGLVGFKPYLEVKTALPTGDR